MTVSVDARDAHHVSIEVHNQGAIPADLLPTIFEPFSRGQGSRPGGRGLGLGLYIAERVVDAHGGEVGVTSSEEAGTTFCVRLPRHPVVTRGKQGRPAQNGASHAALPAGSEEP